MDSSIELENGEWEEMEELIRHAASADGISTRQTARLGDVLT